MKVGLITIGLAGTLFLGGCWHVSTPPPPSDNTSPTQPATNTNNTSIDTADWQTYTNEEYGFGFRYPREWQLVKAGLPKNIIRVRHSGETQRESAELVDGAMFNVIIIEKAAQKVLEDKYIPSSHSRSAQSFHGANAIISEGKMEYAGNTIELSYESNVVVSMKNHSYFISLLSVGGQYQLYKDQLAVILSTIKFTP